MEPDELDNLRQKAIEWTGILANSLRENLISRNAVASTPQVLAALGAMGHAVLYENAPGKHLPMTLVLQRLAQIDWTKGRCWVGVAGKETTDGQFSQAGGAKEWTSRIYSALTASNHPLYTQVTRSSVDAAQPSLLTNMGPDTTTNRSM